MNNSTPSGCQTVFNCILLSSKIHLTLSSRRPDLPGKKILIELRPIRTLAFLRQQTAVPDALFQQLGAALGPLRLSGASSGGRHDEPIPRTPSLVVVQHPQVVPELVGHHVNGGKSFAKS